MKSEEYTFGKFWEAYGLKRDRVRAERAWNRLSAKDKRAALDGIKPYRQDCSVHKRMMMYAQGYLNNRRWEDDFSSPTPIIQEWKGEQEPASPSVQPAVPCPQLSESEQRSVRYEEQRRKAVSWEDAMKSDEYWKAFNKN